MWNRSLGHLSWPLLRCEGTATIFPAPHGWLSYSMPPCKGFSCLYSWSRSFGYYPKLLAIGVGGEVNQSVNWERRLFSEALSINATQYCRDFSLGSGRVLLLCFLSGRQRGRITETIEAFLQPPDNNPSQCQYLPIYTINSVGSELLPPPEAPGSLPELLQGLPQSLLHGLPKLPPLPPELLRAWPAGPISSSRVLTSIHGSIGLLFELLWMVELSCFCCSRG